MEESRDDRTMRASDADRDRVAEQWRQAAGDGRLSIAKAVFGGLSRRGQWVVPSHYTVKAVFGGAELDLREARLESHEVTIDVKAVFGGVDVVRIGGKAVFGGVSVHRRIVDSTG